MKLSARKSRAARIGLARRMRSRKPIPKTPHAPTAGGPAWLAVACPNVIVVKSRHASTAGIAAA